MAGVSTPDMAAAVSNAGALGSIAIGAANVKAARRMIVETKEKTNKPFNVNVFCHLPAVRNQKTETVWLEYLAPLFDEFEAQPPEHLTEIYKSFAEDDDALSLLLEEKPAIVSFHFGIPAQDKINALRAAGICLLATATNLDEAKQIERAGLDGIVAQGIEAGGHRGQFDPAAHDAGLPMADLVSILVKDVTLPVIAAGGIMDGHDIRAALVLGAAAAQLGTAFILCPESAADENYKAALRSTRSSDTHFTDVISGRPARGIANRFIVECDTPEKPAVPSYPVCYDAGKALHAAAKAKGVHEFAAHWAGQGARHAREMSAGVFVETLVREMAIKP